MGQGTITDDEARKMLEMLKSLFEDELNFPLPGKKLEFEAVGENKRDLFVVSIFRGKIQSAKVNIGARIKVNGVMLLELHLNPTNVHQNPDGRKITGSHWHIYTEEYGRSMAYEAEDIKSDNFVENTLAFLKRFRFLYKGIIIKHNKTEPTYTKTSLFLCEKRRFLWPGLRKEGNLFKLAGPGGLAFFHLTKKEVSKWPMKK
jgi:hypothetical protein